MRIEATPRNRAGELALEIYRRTLEQVRGDRLVREHVQLNDQHLFIDDLSYHLFDFDRVVVAGAGKASVAMAQGLEQVLGSRIHDGLIITKHGHGEPLQFCQVMEASHPVPGADSLAAGQEMLKFAERYSGERNLVLFVLSGGASALMEAPVEWITLDDLKSINQFLLDSGATIMMTNAIRSRLSRIKAGGLSKAFGQATVVVLCMSDVDGDNLRTIGSGPFVSANQDIDLESAITSFGLDQVIPTQARGLFGQRSQLEPASSQPVHKIIGNHHLLGMTASVVAKELGLNPPMAGGMWGQARQFPDSILRRKLMIFYDCLIHTGETVVRKQGNGLGGRAQEMACEFAKGIEGKRNYAVLSAGSDGTDGPTDAAGALVDAQTVVRAAEKGFTVAKALADNDSYHFHQAAGTLVKTGPTGTNLNDILIVVRANESN